MDNIPRMRLRLSVSSITDMSFKCKCSTLVYLFGNLYEEMFFLQGQHCSCWYFYVFGSIDSKGLTTLQSIFKNITYYLKIVDRKYYFFENFLLKVVDICIRVSYRGCLF